MCYKWFTILDTSLMQRTFCNLNNEMLNLNSQYPGYTWQYLVDTDLSCHMVLGSTFRFLLHTVKSFHSSFHTNNMVVNHSDEISINETVSIKEYLV